MSIGNMGNPFGSGGGTSWVDHFIGRVYPTVKLVADNLDQLVYIVDNMNEFKPHEIEFQFNSDIKYLQWRYVGTENWFNLVYLNDMTSEQLIEAVIPQIMEQVDEKFETLTESTTLLASSLGNLNTGPSLVPEALWGSVSSVENDKPGATDALNVQAQELANRTELLRDNQELLRDNQELLRDNQELLRDNQKRTVLQFATLADAEAAAATLPDGQIVDDSDEKKRYYVNGGALVFDSLIDDASVTKYKPKWVSAVTTDVASKLDYVVSVKDFGALGDGVSNDSPAFNAAILQCAIIGGGKIIAPYAHYKLSTSVIIPSNVELELNNSLVSGPGINGVDDLFQSGYLSGGSIVTNIGAPPETIQVHHAAVRNATIQHCGKAFNLYNWIDNCEVSNIKFIDCTYAVYASRCFYSRFINLFSRGSANGATNASFHFTSFVNVCQIESVFAVDRNIGIEVSGGANGQVLLNCSAESCVTGIKISDETGPIKLDTCYVENISGVGVDLFNAGVKDPVTFDNCFFNVCSVAIKGSSPGSGSNITIRENNRFVACTTIFDGGDNFESFGKIEIKPTSISGNGFPSIPDGYAIGGKYRLDHENIIFDGNSGLGAIRTKVHGPTLIPFEHEGNPGAPVANSIAFCQHSKSSGTPFSIYVDTRITYGKLSSLLVYRFTVSDDSGSYQLYGLIFGDKVKSLDETGKTVTVSNNGGFVRLTLSTFAHPAGQYGCTGVLRHM